MKVPVAQLGNCFVIVDMTAINLNFRTGHKAVIMGMPVIIRCYPGCVMNMSGGIVIVCCIA